MHHHALLHLHWRPNTICICSQNIAVARFFYGLGADNIEIPENVLLVKWFMGKEMPLAMSLETCFSRIGNAIALVTQKLLNNYFDSPLPGLYVSLIVMFVSFISCWILVFIEKTSEKKI